MKNSLSLITMFIFSILILQTSCRKDDVPPEVEEEEEPINNPDGFESGDDLIESVDYSTL